MIYRKSGDPTGERLERAIARGREPGRHHLAPPAGAEGH